jgi:hypothetical protein
MRVKLFSRTNNLTLREITIMNVNRNKKCIVNQILVHGEFSIVDKIPKLKMNL